jgi:hypothetical protein
MARALGKIAKRGAHEVFSTLLVEAISSEQLSLYFASPRNVLCNRNCISKKLQEKTKSSNFLKVLSPRCRSKIKTKTLRRESMGRNKYRGTTITHSELVLTQPEASLSI